MKALSIINISTSPPKSLSPLHQINSNKMDGRLSVATPRESFSRIRVCGDNEIVQDKSFEQIDARNDI